MKYFNKITIYAILLERCGIYGAVYFGLLKTVTMFASETGMTLPLTGPDSYLPSKSSEQVKRLAGQKKLNLKPRTMKKLYASLFSAYTLLSEAIHLQLFPVPGHVKGLSQMQPVFVPTINKKF